MNMRDPFATYKLLDSDLTPWDAIDSEQTVCYIINLSGYRITVA